MVIIFLFQVKYHANTADVNLSQESGKEISYHLISQQQHYKPLDNTKKKLMTRCIQFSSAPYYL